MINKVSAIFADIDGTLVNKGENIMPVTKQALETLHSQGVLLGLSTGRKINNGMFQRAKDWGLSFQFDMMIGMNGGQLWDRFHPEIENYYLLKTETMKEIIERMSPLDLNVMIYEDEHMVTLRFDDMIAASMKRNHMEIIDTHGDYDRLCVRPVHTVIYRYFPEQQENVMRHIHDYLSSHPETEYTSVNTFPGIVEIIHKNCNKGEGVKVFAKQSGLEMNQIAGMGDMDNDLGLMTAGIGIALKNGSEKMKAAADFVTEFTCDEDGAGKFLLKHWIEPLGWK
jgi:Cof subfamily protein (haloacid dehalogenase superfamily)